MFAPIPYLEWIHGRPETAEYDLGSSDLRPTAADDGGGVVPPRLDGLPDPPGGTDLEALLAERYGVSRDAVLVTAGATHGNYLTAAAAIGTSDAATPQVLVERPGYQPLTATPGALGARVDRFERPRANDFALKSERVRDAADDDLAMVTVTNRHNPSGRLVDRERLEDVAAVAADRDAVLLVDEVYAPFVSPGDERDGAFGGVTATGVENAVVTGSLTKFFGLGELSVGWLVGPPAFLERAIAAGMHLPLAADVTRTLARRAVYNADELAADRRTLLDRNHQRLRRFVADRDDLSGTVFPGATYAFVSHDRVDGDALTEAAWQRGVLVVPGRFFDSPDAVRVSLGRPPDVVDAGLDALGAALDDL